MSSFHLLALFAALCCVPIVSGIRHGGGGEADVAEESLGISEDEKRGQDVAEEPLDISDGLANFLLQVAGKELTSCRGWDMVCKGREKAEQLKRWRDEQRRKAEEYAKRKADEARKVVEDAKRKAEEYAKRKADQVRKVAEDAKRVALKAAEDAKKAAEDAKKKVEGQLDKTMNDILKTVMEHGGGDIIMNLVATYKDLEKFNKCLQGLPEKYHIDKVIGWVGSFKGDWGGLAEGFNDRYLADAMKSLAGFADKTINGMTDLKDLKNLISSPDQFQQVLGGIMDKAWESLKELTEQPGFEVARCLVSHVLAPAISKIKPIAIQVFQTFQKELVAPMKKIQEKVTDAVATKVDEAYNMVWTNNEGMTKLAAIASEAASAYCMSTSESTFKDLDQLDPSNPSYPEQIKSLVARLQGSSLGALPRVAGNALSALLRNWVTQLEQDVIGPLIRAGLDIIKSITTPVLHAIDGLCGLIPEVGGAICAVITTLTGSADIWLQNLQFSSTKQLIHIGLVSLMDKVDAFVKNAIEGVTHEAEGIIKWLAPLEKIFSKLAAALVPGVREKLDACDAQKKGVLKLLTLANSHAAEAANTN